MKKLQQSGSIAIVVIVAFILLIGAAVAWRVYASKNHQNAAKSTSTSNKTNAVTKTTTTTATDPYAGWQSYCSDMGGVCFKYPSDWKFQTAPSTDGGSSAARVLSPTGKVGIDYEPNIDSLGGACNPSTCYFQAKEIVKPSGTNVGNLKIVSGVYTGRDANVAIPELAVMSDDIISRYGLTVESNVDVGAIYYVFTNPKDSAKQNKLIAYDTNNSTYAQSTDAASWLNQPEVTTARQILMSVTIK